MLARFQSLDLSPGGNGTFKRGEINMPKGKKAMAVRLKTTVTINNATGGASTLSDAEKQTLLSKIRLRMAFGSGEEDVPYDLVDAQVMRDLARYCTGIENRGYADTVTGLGKSIPNGAGQTVVFDIVIPTGRLWFLAEQHQRLFGLGRSQLADMALRVELDSSVVVKTNVSITSIQTLLLTDNESCKGDFFGAMPWYRTDTRPEDEFRLAKDGLPLLVLERSAVHASSLLTAFSLFIGGEPIHQNVSVQDSVVDYSQAPLANAASLLVDRATVLYAIPPTGAAQLTDLPTGDVRIRQDTKTLATMSVAMLWLPVMGAGRVKRALEAGVAKRGGKALKAVGIAAVKGVALPDRVEAVMGAQIVDRDDREWEEMPGASMAGIDKDVVEDVPPAVIARAASAKRQNEAAGAKLAGAAIAKRIASAIPGAVANGRGFSGAESSVLERVKAALS